MKYIVVLNVLSLLITRLFTALYVLFLETFNFTTGALFATYPVNSFNQLMPPVNQLYGKAIHFEVLRL